MGSISIQKHEMEIWEYGINIFKKTSNVNFLIWEQYLQENMNVEFGNCQSKKLKQLHLFLFQLKEALPPIHIPIPTPAPAHPLVGTSGPDLNGYLSRDKFGDS